VPFSCYTTGSDVNNDKWVKSLIRRLFPPSWTHMLTNSLVYGTRSPRARARAIMSQTTISHASARTRLPRFARSAIGIWGGVSWNWLLALMFKVQARHSIK
jgi:hypothetical protein